MKSIILLFWLISTSQSEVSLQEEYDKSSFVALAKIGTIEDDYFNVKLLEVYKNNFLDAQSFATDNWDETLIEGEIYLLFASPGEKTYELRLSETTNPIYISDISLETFRFLNGQPCINVKETLEERKKKNPNVTGACYRGAGPKLCGCNAKQYYSGCEMHKEGVMKYRVSPECEN